MAKLKHKIEAILFSAGRRMAIEEIARLCKATADKAEEALKELFAEYGERDSSLALVQDGKYWKLTVQDQHQEAASSVVTQTELSKTLMETLAVIAFKYPIKQADLIKIRTNKAYEHLSELEGGGFISRKKHGRSKLIKLADKFFHYFNLPEESLREKFRDFESIAKAIEEKEGVIEGIKVRQKKEAEEMKKAQEVREGEIDLVDDEGNKVALDVIDEPEMSGDEAPDADAKETEGKDEARDDASTFKARLGKLEVVDEPIEQEEAVRSKERSEEAEPLGEGDNGEQDAPAEEEVQEPADSYEGETYAEDQENDAHPDDEAATDEQPEPLSEGGGLPQEAEGGAAPAESQSDIDKRVEAMLNPRHESSSEGEEEKDVPDDPFRDIAKRKKDGISTESDEHSPLDEAEPDESFGNAEGDHGDDKLPGRKKRQTEEGDFSDSEEDDANA